MRLPTDDQHDLRSACRTVLAAHSTSPHLRAVAESPGRFDAALYRLVSGLGWTALTVPQTHGGLGLGLVDAGIVAEELGRVVHGGPLAHTLGAAALIDRYAQDSMRDLILPQIAEGSATVALGTDRGMAIPGTGLTLLPVAEPAQGQAYQLDGRLDWVANAAVATHLLLAANLDGECRAVLIEARVVQVEPMRSVDLTCEHGRVTAAAVLVPADAVLAAPSGDTLFDVAVMLQCAESVGIASRLLDMTVEYARQRVQFGQPIGKFQAVKHKLADMLVAREAARACTWEAAGQLDDDALRAAEAVSVAKSIAGAAGSDVASQALQIHGGIGFTWEHDLHLFLRRAKINELLLGSPSWHEERLTALLESTSLIDLGPSIH